MSKKSKKKDTFQLTDYFKSHPNIISSSIVLSVILFLILLPLFGLTPTSLFIILIVVFPISLILCIISTPIIETIKTRTETIETRTETIETTTPKDRIQLSKDEIIVHRAKLFAQYFYLVVAGIVAIPFVYFLVQAFEWHRYHPEYHIFWAISLLVCIASIVKCIITRNINVILTNKRLFIARGVASLNIQNLRLSKIERFDISQGFWARLFNTSTIKIRGIGGGLNTIKLRGIKDPLPFLNAFNTACDALESGKSITPTTPNTEITNNTIDQPDNTTNQPEINTNTQDTTNTTTPNNTTNQPEINTNTQDTTNTTTPTTSTP